MISVILPEPKTFDLYAVQNLECAMKTNMGSADRLIRLVLTVILGGLYFSGTVTGTWGIIVLVLAIVMLLTSMVGFCPLYVPFGISTDRKIAEH